MNKLYRSNHNVRVSGVCGGVGERFGVDPTWIRLGTVAATLFTGGGFLLFYIAAAIIIPKEPIGSASVWEYREYGTPKATGRYGDYKETVRASSASLMTEEEQLAIRQKIDFLRSKLAKSEQTEINTQL